MAIVLTTKSYLFSLLIISTLVLSLALCLNINSNNQKIAYLNTDKLLDSYQGMVTARAQYQREKKEWKQNIAVLSQEAQQAILRAQQAAKSANSTEKLRRERESRFKQEQLFNYQQAVAKQEPEEMARLTQPIIALVNHHIATYSQTHQFSLVLTTAGQGDVVYSDKKMDITQDVTEYLNKYLADSLAGTPNTPSSRNSP